MSPQIDHVRRELLLYLSDLPHLVREEGPDSIGKVCLDLGKCLLWLQNELEPKIPRDGDVKHAVPRTIYCLGTQLLEIGQHYWDAREKGPRFERLEQELRICQDRLDTLENESAERRAVA